MSDLNTPRRPSHSLRGKIAIVTGAGSQSSGIGNGRAAAILLAESGANVVCADRNLQWAQVTENMINEEFGEGSALSVQADVTQDAECQKIVATAISAFGRLDILVNNVGIGGPSGTAVDVDPVEWARGLDVNVTSMMLMVKHAVPAMEKNTLDSVSGRGAIVNIGSVTGLLGGPPMLLYPVSKGAVVQMTRAMAVHHAASGIRVNCVNPGTVYTPMVSTPGMSAETRLARTQGSLLKTEGNAWDTGCAVRFLASEEARWITGVNLAVDAGSTASMNITMLAKF